MKKRRKEMILERIRPAPAPAEGEAMSEEVKLPANWGGVTPAERELIQRIDNAKFLAEVVSAKGKTMESIADLEKRVLRLASEHQAACEASERAHKDETAALNRLNAAQKDFDEAILGMRAAARRETDWGRPKEERS